MDRHHFDAIVSPQDWHDTYQPIFQACIVDGNVSGIMCSANAVNGIPSCANKQLLTGVLRDELGFSGYITGDDGSAMEILTTHKYTATAAEAVAAFLHAGGDVDDGTFVTPNLPDALSNKTVNLTEHDLTAPLERLFGVRLRLGILRTKHNLLISLVILALFAR
jgi:beta-glucosidase-like glycosyl hydrolase